MQGLKRIFVPSLLAVSALAALPAPADAYTYSTITTFNGTNGAAPESSMIRSGNKFYGVTENTVFRYNSNNGHFDVLWTACTTTGCATNFFGKLVIDTSGNLYGTAVDGGANGGGAVFELVKPAMGTTWSFVDLYDFCSVKVGTVCTDGKFPNSLAYDGSSYDGTSQLFGTTSFGGTSNDGAVFTLHLSGGVWSEKAIHSFSGAPSDGSGPRSVLFVDSLNNLWGTTSSGGSATNRGIAFELAHGANLWTSPWTETVIYNFCWNGGSCPDGWNPGALVADASGNFLGAAVGGGSGPAGVVYKLSNGSCHEGGTPTFWCSTVLYNFLAGNDGQAPYSELTLDGSGNIFGTTILAGANSEGTAYEVSGTSETTLYAFCSAASCDDGSQPMAGLTFDASGDLFGLTSAGGSSGEGVLFELTP